MGTTNSLCFDKEAVATRQWIGLEGIGKVLKDLN